MPEIHLTIAQRTYRLAVRRKEKDSLTQCAQRVDDCITKVRSQSRLPSTEHSAVLAALQIAFEDSQKIHALENELTHVNNASERQPASARATTSTRQKLPLEMTTRSQRHQLLEKQWKQEIQELCSLCEKELFFVPRTKSLF